MSISRINESLMQFAKEIWQEVEEKGESFILVESVAEIKFYREMFSGSKQITLVIAELSTFDEWSESPDFDDGLFPEVRLVELDGNGGFLLKEVDPKARVGMLTEKGREYLRQKIRIG